MKAAGASAAFFICAFAGDRRFVGASSCSQLCAAGVYRLSARSLGHCRKHARTAVRHIMVFHNIIFLGATNKMEYHNLNE
jgi:hypothetical protein